MPPVDSQLYQDIGALKAMSEERSKQTELLFELVRQLPTKDDLQAMAASCGACEDLTKRVSSLETDRRMIKTAAGTAIGAPPIIAAAIEIGRWMFKANS